MNNELFQQARSAYARRDFESALNIYLQCLQEDPSALGDGEMGMLYHQIGNCLVKLKNPSEAVTAYSQAAADATYSELGVVNCNLGKAYAALRDHESAVEAFDRALDDPSYATPYKAFTGKGSSLLKLGKNAEAGVAFREAALDETNPDPTKALLKLGVCFMALNRPADAIASYESALQFPLDPGMRNKIQANLGQACVASGQMEKAIESFESALMDGTYALSDSANVDYQRAMQVIAHGGAAATQAIDPVSADMSGLDVSADGSDMYQNPYAAQAQDSFFYADPYQQAANAPYDPYVNAQGAEDHFFNSSDAELLEWSKGIAKQDRKRRNVGLKILIAFILLLVVAFGGAVFLYTQGFGYPQQADVAKELFADPEGSADLFASDISADEIASMTAALPAGSDATVDGESRSMRTSTVYVTTQTEEGGEVQYEVSMVRDMIGWKVSDVDLYFPSEH